MNAEQFERLVKAVQWSIDEHLGKSDSTLAWNQDVYGTGVVTEEIVAGVSIAPGREYLADYYRDVKVVCSSGCCIAGNLALSDGGRMVVPAEHGPGETTSDYVLTPEGAVDGVWNRAEALMGASSEFVDSDDYGYDLFEGSNSISDVVAIAAAIAQAHGHDLPARLQGIADLGEIEWLEATT